MPLVVKKQTATYSDESMRLDFSPVSEEEEEVIIFHNACTKYIYTHM